ncbi:glutamine-hydrolyzing carbamoyl-phosphate synthase small subunit [Carboxylicivirga sp. M1479]|uniref:glutamine-hydrolyzing carbamoyl-phosphate synthase small subunit n=1 Tax=Carboxylicivirga sp. M1479 TaxID=2594476 RepID=UPI00117886F3|nr:glutamine-hydrolyzing carbamoyl-phosphate synthase small subunit [Carboxylicivirga sp. M1479]TRX72269.1 glutamine-hydrolyzing carbamoyl-phosphate synthase small subunit [Carboxylicivirga sp. M1479]
MPEIKKIKLVLEDGTVFEGKSFGYHQSVAGEVVFNTAMTGYPESLTDPSYEGQILVSTYPLIGNYGVPKSDVENGIPKFHESDRIHISGLVISDYSFEYSHWNAENSLREWLIQNKVPGIFDIDTRALTMILREKGAMLGKIEVEGDEIDFVDPNKENLVAKVSVKEKKVYGNGKHKVVLVDTGAKNNILRSLLKRDTTVIRVPWDYDFTQEDYDGIMLSNGPGDPQMCEITIKHIQKAMEIGKPIFGICLGNQLLGIASGASTYKLKYGHRAHNHPVIRVGTDTCYITSQNHGFAIDNDTLTDEWEPFFVNINDKTNEGVIHKTKPFFSTQFHPEASSGPTDTEFLFDVLIKKIEESKL